MGASVITVCQHKGGVGKTTTALNVAGYLAQKGRVLIVDMDPQENATIGLGVESHDDQGRDTVAAVIKQKRPLEEVICSTTEDNIFAVPGHYSMSYLDWEMASVVSREWVLDKALETIKGEFEWIIVDTQPHLGVGTLMAAVSADLILVPLKLDYYSLRGLNMILRFSRVLTDDLGLVPELRFVCTMKRLTNMAAEAEEAIRDRLGRFVYQTAIPLNVTLEEAPSHSQTIAKYDPDSAGGIAYKGLTKEILRDLQVMGGVADGEA